MGPVSSFFLRSKRILKPGFTFLAVQFRIRVYLLFQSILFLLLLERLHADVGTDGMGFLLIVYLDEVVDLLALNGTGLILHCVEIEVDIDVVLAGSSSRGLRLYSASPTVVHDNIIFAFHIDKSMHDREVGSVDVPQQGFKL